MLSFQSDFDWLDLTCYDIEGTQRGSWSAASLRDNTVLAACSHPPCRGDGSDRGCYPGAALGAGAPGVMEGRVSLTNLCGQLVVTGILIECNHTLEHLSLRTDSSAVSISLSPKARLYRGRGHLYGGTEALHQGNGGERSLE